MSAFIESWESISLGDLNSYRSGTINPADFPDEIFELYSVPIFPSGKPEIINGHAIGSTKQIVEQGDVLICKINPRINRVWQVAARNKLRQIASSEWIVLRASETNPTFLRFFCRSPEFRELLCTDLTGVGGSLTRAQPKRVARFTVPIPPLPEQNRIADKLEAVLGRVDACRARLARVPDLLKRFRQSILAAATSGRLTEDWRIKSRISSAKQPIMIGEGRLEIPSNWKIGQINDVIDPQRPLCYGVVQPGDERLGGVPLIRVQDMMGGQIAVEELRTVSASVDAEYKRSRVKQGDLLLSVVGTIGRTSIVPSNLEANIARAIARIACKQGIDSRWINYWLSFEAMQWWLTSSSKEVARKTLNLSDVAAAPIAVPPEAEQKEVIRRVENLFALVDRIEARLSEAQTTVDRLTPSTLAKAFRGELVPQDPNDEPASALLERIRQERSASSTGKDTAKRRTSNPKTRVPKQESAMTKSRFDDDVKGKAYLAGLLRNCQAPLNAEALFKLSELPLVDFYKQLAWEVQKGHIRDDRTKLEAVS